MSQGRCYLYVFPCAYEDFLKLGFSRDPLSRLQALHPRYYEVFDIDRGFLVETETVRDARDLELRLGRTIRIHNAPAPLVIRRAAGGHREWYRGAYGNLEGAAGQLAAEGYSVHQPLREWLRNRLMLRSDLLFSWSRMVFDAIQLDQASGEFDDARRSVRATLKDALDAYSNLGIDLEPLVPDDVMAWHRGHRDA